MDGLRGKWATGNFLSSAVVTSCQVCTFPFLLLLLFGRALQTKAYWASTCFSVRWVFWNTVFRSRFSSKQFWPSPVMLLLNQTDHTHDKSWFILANISMTSFVLAYCSCNSWQVDQQEPLWKLQDNLQSTN